MQTPDLFAEVTSRLEELLEGSETLVHAAWYAEPGEYLTSPMNLACLTGTLNLARRSRQSGASDSLVSEPAPSTTLPQA